MYGHFCRAAKKSGRNNEVTILPLEVAVRWGSTVVLFALIGQVEGEKHNNNL